MTRTVLAAALAVALSGGGAALPPNRPNRKEDSMSVVVRTEQYEFANSGRKPRGHGYWFFELRDSRSKRSETVAFTGLYAEAKKQAVAAAFAGDYDTVRVQS
jgi:hypothetical protein